MPIIHDSFETDYLSSGLLVNENGVNDNGVNGNEANRLWFNDSIVIGQGSDKGERSYNSQNSDNAYSQKEWADETGAIRPIKHVNQEYKEALDNQEYKGPLDDRELVLGDRELAGQYICHLERANQDLKVLVVIN